NDCDCTTRSSPSRPHAAAPRTRPGAPRPPPDSNACPPTPAYRPAQSGPAPDRPPADCGPPRSDTPGVGSVQIFQPALQLLRALAGPGLTRPLARPLRAFHHPIVLGTRRGVPAHTHLQADQPQRQVGRQVTP